MRNIVIYFVVIVTLTGCSQKKKVANGTYLAFFYETEWRLEIENNKFTHVRSGHLGNDRPVSGSYKIKGDTLILLTDSLSCNKFLIDGDSCLIDVEMQADYCIRKSDAWQTEWRNINYPQIKTDNEKTKKVVLWMLETVLNSKEILEYFPDTTKSIVVQEYYELNKLADLNLKSHGTKITFLAEKEIKKRKIEDYLIVSDVRLGVTTGKVIFQVMPEFSSSILEFFEKQNGKWVQLEH